MKILTIDGNNLVHRVYWVANNMKYKTEYFHVYMFLNSVKSYAELYQPDKIFVVWDEKPDYQKNQRKEDFEDYKANRDSEKAKEVHSKNEDIKALLKSMGIPSIFPRKYEADDAIGFIDTFYWDAKHVVVTVDRDLCQLINEDTVVYDPIRKYEINEANFKEKLKYDPEDFIKVKAIQGDKSDNISGIKGFGKAKIEKYLKGEIELDEEQEYIYKRNMSLVELTQNASEEKYVYDQLEKAKKIDTDWQLFLEKCNEFKFTNITNNEGKWYTAFFEKNRLIDILS